MGSSKNQLDAATKTAPSWTFFTNHAHVLFVLAVDPDARMRDVASAVGITERAVHRILHELEESGYLAIERVGRRNTYAVNVDAHLRHPIEENVSIIELLRILKRAQKKRAE